MFITSRSNEHVKRAKALAMAKERNQTGLHLIEGDKLLNEAVRSGMEIIDVFVREGLAISRPYDACVHQVSASVLSALTDTASPQGVAAIVRTPVYPLPERFPQGLIVVLDRLQDPGNVGAIIRTADAFGAQCVILSPDSADPFSPKSIRASMGSSYHIPLYIMDALEAVKRLTAEGCACIAGHLGGSEALPPFSGSAALFIGNEGRGVSSAVSERCYAYRLPMKGRAESLNASVAAGILIYKLSEEL